MPLFLETPIYQSHIDGMGKRCAELDVPNWTQKSLLQTFELLAKLCIGTGANESTNNGTDLSGAELEPMHLCEKAPEILGMVKPHL